jgi:RimJ/RimL family protein N-acetyltransferase
MSTIRVTLYEDEEVLVECDYLFNRTKVAMHISFNEEVWSHSFFKRMKYLYIDILQNFKNEGYNEIYGAPLKGNLKAKKLAKMFGFKDFFENNDLYLMRMEIN